MAALREQAGLSQREMARRLGVSQPRVAAIERSRNVTVDVLEQYVLAAGGQLEISVTNSEGRLPLVESPVVAARPDSGTTAPRKRAAVLATVAPRRRTARVEP